MNRFSINVDVVFLVKMGETQRRDGYEMP